MKPAASAMFFQRRGHKPRVTVTANRHVPFDELVAALKPWTATLVRTDGFGHCFAVHVVEDGDTTKEMDQKIDAAITAINEVCVVRGWTG